METIDIIALIASSLFFLAGLLFFVLTCYIIHKRTKKFRKYGYWRGWRGYYGPYGPTGNPYADPNCGPNPYYGANPNGTNPTGNPYGYPEPPRDPDSKDVKN